MDYLFGFGGRFNRSDWWTTQIIVVGAIGLSLYWLGVDISFARLTRTAFTAAIERKGLISIAPFLACGWISCAAAAKRYHDRDKSGFWCLVALIPYVGALWQLVECGFLAGTAGPNSYGEGRAGKRAPMSEAEEMLAARMRFREEPHPAVAPAAETAVDAENRFLGRSRNDVAPVLFGRGR